MNVLCIRALFISYYCVYRLVAAADAVHRSSGLRGWRFLSVLSSPVLRPPRHVVPQRASVRRRPRVRRTPAELPWPGQPWCGGVQSPSGSTATGTLGKLELCEHHSSRTELTVRPFDVYTMTCFCVQSTVYCAISGCRLMRACDLPPKELENLTTDRSSWRSSFKKQVSDFERRRILSLQDKRVQRKTGRQLSPDCGFTCDIRSRVCASRIGPISHQRTHLWSRDPSCRRLSPTIGHNLCSCLWMT